MSELRQDATIKQWVIVATERAKRPHSFVPVRRLKELPPHDASCPFCPGNESQTPGEVMRVRGDGSPGASGWMVRVVPNKFAALTMGGSIARREEGEFFRKMDGVGVHEVIIESPLHNGCLALMPEEQVAQVLYTYRTRYNDLRNHPLLRFILIFKNQGESAGTSLEHPHSQLVATPVPSPRIQKKFEVAMSYYDDSGRCLYCDLFRHELDAGVRVINDTENFVVFHPYASRSPFETWIAPKVHQPCFGTIIDEEVEELARVLKDTLLRMYRTLNHPDFNYVIATSPTDHEDNRFYDWHIIIIPRLTTVAGFEMGSGIYINTALPEETAEFMRQARPAL
jgi:UDPglucose--hexose-1-phosphate uridylyltransferase